MATLYGVLSLSPQASSIDIKTNYRKLSLRFHPDSGGSTEKMVLLNEAYRILSNPLLRREYDQKLLVAQQRIVQTPMASHTSYSETAWSRPTTATPTTYRQPRHATYPNTTYQQGTFWPWFGVLSVLSLGFLVYEIHAGLQQIVQPTAAATPQTSAQTALTSPVSAVQSSGAATPDTTTTSSSTSATSTTPSADATTVSNNTPSISNTETTNRRHGYAHYYESLMTDDSSE